MPDNSQVDYRANLTPEEELVRHEAGSLLSIVDEIRASDIIIDKKVHFAKKYPDFAKTYPVLMDMALNPKTDYTQLRFMLNALDRIQKDSSKHEETETAVGQQLFDKFVSPKLGKKK